MAFAVLLVLSTADASTVNPMRKVITMLQMMENKVEAEGKKNEELFDKFMCYCKTAEEELSASIAEAEEKIPQLEASIKEAVEQKKLMKDQLVQHKADRADAEEAIAKASAIRKKEAAAFAAESAESNSNIAALNSAIPAIEKGMAGSFLQTTAAGVVRQLSVTADLNSADRDMLSSFLSVGQGDDQGYAPASGEIVGILKQMKDEMEKDVADITATENEAAADFEGLVGAKKKEIAAATKAIEEKIQRSGELAVQIATEKNDLEDTKEGLAEDKVYLANLDKQCAAKKEEWKAYQATHGQELVALADVIKMLSDDDALDLFKKTMPSAAASSFIQLQVSQKELRTQALSLLQSGRRPGRSLPLDFIALALKGKKVGFEKVIKMIDDMSALLKKEQVDDDQKKEYCEAEFDSAEDKQKALERALSDLEKAIAEQEDTIETLGEQIVALKAGIEALDKSVAEATEQRKADHAENTETLAANNAAKELVAIAKNRLNKFYNPKMYKAPPKRELSEEERITLNMGGTLAPTNPPAGIAGTGVVALVQLKAHSQLSDDSQDAPAPPPAADLSYKKKGEESGGVIGMMDNLSADLDKEIQEIEFDEKDGQEEYEETMLLASEKRATDSKAITDKGGAKAEMEAEHQANKDAVKATSQELGSTKAVLADLHADCDWLIQNFAARKEARANEIDAMGKAKAVLNGADYSLVQTSRRLRRARV